MFQEGFERRYIRWMKDAKKSAKVSIVRIALRDLAFSRIKNNLYDYTHSVFNTP